MLLSKLFSRWLLRWQHKASRASDLPFGLSETEIEGLKQLVASPQWRHYLRVLDGLGEQQASELASALPHDRYLFTCGSLYALRRVYSLVSDVLAATKSLKEIEHVRVRASLERERRAANAFLNTPWWDAYQRDSAAREAGTLPLRR